MASEERQGISNIFMLGIVRYIWVCMHVDSMGHYGAVGMGRRGEYATGRTVQWRGIRLGRKSWLPVTPFAAPWVSLPPLMERVQKWCDAKSKGTILQWKIGSRGAGVGEVWMMRGMGNDSERKDWHSSAKCL